MGQSYRKFLFFILALAFTTVLGCGGSTPPSPNAHLCNQTNFEEKAICVRQDLAPLKERRDALIAQARAEFPAQASTFIAHSQMKSKSVYEYCFALLEEPINCMDEKFQAEIDTLEFELKYGTPST